MSDPSHLSDSMRPGDFQLDFPPRGRIGICAYRAFFGGGGGGGGGEAG